MAWNRSCSSPSHFHVSRTLPGPSAGSTPGRRHYKSLRALVIAYFRRQNPLRLATVGTAVRIPKFRGTRLNHTLSNPFRSLAAFSQAAPISLDASPHSSLGHPDPCPWPAGRWQEASMRTPKSHGSGPGLPGGVRAKERPSRARLALPSGLGAAMAAHW